MAKSSGSTLAIEAIDPTTGQMTGRYTNNASGYSCQGTAYPVIGYIYNDLIGWAVRWSNTHEDCKSITDWTGYYDSGTRTITTKWNLVYGTKISPGSDTFRQVPQRTSQGLKSK